MTVTVRTMKRAVAVSLATLACVLAGTAVAAPSVRYGIQDDAWLEFGTDEPIAARAKRLKALGLDVVRVTLRWSEIEAQQGEFDWDRPDALLEGLQEAGIDPLVTIWGTPRWANGGRSTNWAPDRGADFAAFATTVAERYSWVRYWLIWNEPNQRRWLRPTTAGDYVDRILNPAYDAIKAVIPTARVGGGATAPRASWGGISPVDFIRDMGAAGAKLDAYAHHPYAANSKEGPLDKGCAKCKTLTIGTLDRLLLETAKAFGPSTRIWLTEFAYQTNPPDRSGGVPLATQARYISEAAERAYSLPRVDLLIHYLYRDEPALAGWQSGLQTVDNRAKPSLQAIQTPFSQVRRSGDRTVLWAQVRAATGPQRYEIQRRAGSAWTTIATGATTSRGYLRAVVTAGAGTRLRLSVPVLLRTSAVLVVR